MKKIKNHYHKALTFPMLSISFQSNEIKEVSDSIAIQLLRNPWLIEEKTIIKPISVEKPVKIEEKPKIEIQGDIKVENEKKVAKKDIEHKS